MTTATMEPVVVQPVPRRPEDAMLAVHADTLTDLEKLRIATENRLRQFTRTEPDEDGEMRGFGLDEGHPAVARLVEIVATLREAETLAVKSLEQGVKQHPLGPWVKKTKGIGLKQGGRLLAAIGDPYWHPIFNRPRLVSELWSFCGYGVWRIDPATLEVVPREQGLPPGDLGIAPHRRKGVKSNWNDAAKMRVYLIAEACLKQLEKGCKQEDGTVKHQSGCDCSPYRRIYDETRAKYADGVHRMDCKRCGPSGKPALAGSPLSAGHQHARAMRKMSKEILRDLWLEGKRLHEERNA